ncbi:MAG: hypothetical protein MRY64_03815 [Hyphomonadaceae bacterium]|nr:hypothetical protein [Hyphomonadaceae bacterium]
MDTTITDPTTLIRKFCQQLVSNHLVEKTVPANVHYDWADSDAMSDELFNKMLLSGTYDRSIEKDARTMIESGGGSYEDYPASDKQKLLEGAARVRKEMLRYAAHTRRSVLAPYETSDEDLRSIGVHLGATEHKPVVESITKPTAADPEHSVLFQL